MENLFEKWLEQIKFPQERWGEELFATADIETVEVHKLRNFWRFVLNFDELLPVEDFQLLSDLTAAAFEEIAQTELVVKAKTTAFDDSLLNAYYQYALTLPELSDPAFSNIFKKYKIVQRDVQFNLMVEDNPRLDWFVGKYFPILEQKFADFGLGKIVLRPMVDESLTAAAKEQHAASVQEKIQQISENQVHVEEQRKERPAPSPRKGKAKPAVLDSDKVKLGRDISHKLPISRMIDVVGEEPNVLFQGYVFAAEHKTFKNRSTGKESHMLEIKMTDYSSSFIVQKWGRKDEEIAMFDRVKKGLWLKVLGNLQMDNYKHEITMSATAIEEIPTQNVRKDKAPEGEKRVEFHAHTNMSTMDAIPAVEDLVAQAAKFGHKAIAITDHAGLQSFPHAHSAGKKNGVKILYGLEANLVEDRVPIVYNEVDADLHEGTYVVFDVETTGLSAVYNNLIQIAASKMYKGNVIDEFDEFIDPGHPLSSFTTELTGITNEHVRGSKPLDEVLKLFQDFCKDSILVAHNATFDVGFMNENYRRHDLPTITQPVIDTLEYARNLYPDFKRHGLGPLTKRFGVGLEHHHMANYDAEATGRLLFIFINETRERGITNLNQLNTELVDENSFKQARVKHATIYAKTQAGLKNLFKLVSYSNVKYFSGVPRIPKTVLEAHREGLIIGSACSEGEVWEAITTKSFDQALDVAKFYDFIEIMSPAVYRPLLAQGTLHNEEELQNALQDLIKIGQTLGKPILATGNTHYLNPEDAIYREIIIRSLGQGAPINRPIGRGEHALPAPLPEVHFRTTDEMLEDFAFLGKELAYEIVVTNTQKLADEFDELTPVRDDLYTPVMTFENGEGSEERIVRLTYEKAHEWYGNPLPEIVDARLEKELRSILGNGFSVVYIISQELVKRSNERGYIVGSRGSVGSSLVATMIGITEVNPLAPHYRCPECQYFEVFEDGTYGSGYDMPDKDCPNCSHKLIKDGHDIPFETFLGFKGDKVPDIDLNFSGEDQPFAHLDVRDIFGSDYAFRAGTIAGVQDKTAFGYVLGYERDYGKMFRGAEKERLAAGSTGVKRTTGQHPGGIIVIPSYMDVYDFSPVQYPADDVNAEWQTTHFDFHAIHDNILKLDILGHLDPTMIRKLQSLSGIVPQDIPMDDPEVMKLFTSTESLGVTPEQLGVKLGTLGIPEMGTFTSMNMIAEAKPKTFADLLQISGLSHGTDVWAGNAQDLIRSGIADLSHVIGCRDDIMVYLIHAGLSESMSFQIMERVRKGMWSKIDEEERETYVSEMRAHNVPEWYIESCSKIKYMFPKAHAAAYIMMALRVAYFKVHHPLFYYCAWFSIRADAFDLKVMAAGKDAVKAKMREIKEKGFDASATENALVGTLELCNEMLERGYKFGKLDLYKSEATEFIVEDDMLIPPFACMDGLGENVAKQIVEARKDGEFLSKMELRKRAGVSQTAVEAMDEMGILGNLPEDNQLSLFEDLF